MMQNSKGERDSQNKPSRSLDKKTPIEVQDLCMHYHDFIVMQGLNFSIQKSEIFVIMGESGCGKSTLLKYLTGLKVASHGKIFYYGESFFDADIQHQKKMLKRIGILYQSGALWSSMSLWENVATPLLEYTDLSLEEAKAMSFFKLSLVGLKGYENFYPAAISGGMKKRAGLARAMALDPDILLFDEPSAGLDPITSKKLDDLILQLRDSLGTTIVVVTHELASIFSIADRALFLDAETKSMRALGKPQELLKNSTQFNVKLFLSRGIAQQ